MDTNIKKYKDTLYDTRDILVRDLQSKIEILKFLLKDPELIISDFSDNDFPLIYSIYDIVKDIDSVSNKLIDFTDIV